MSQLRILNQFKFFAFFSDWDGADEATKYYNTIECVELFSAAYPDQYNTFMEEKGRKTRKGQRSLCAHVKCFL